MLEQVKRERVSRRCPARRVGQGGQGEEGGEGGEAVDSHCSSAFSIAWGSIASVSRSRAMNTEREREREREREKIIKWPVAPPIRLAVDTCYSILCMPSGKQWEMLTGILFHDS